VFTNFYTPSGGTEPGNPYTVNVKASIEDPSVAAGKPDGSVTIPVFFNGKRTGTIEPSGILISDPVYVNVADGQPLWVRSMPTVTSGDKWVNAHGTSNVAGANFDGGGVLEGIVTNTDAVDSGTIAGSNSNAFGPAAILGEATGRKPSVLIVGDSIAAETGVVNAGNLSYMTRACVSAGYPTMRVSEGGERFVTIVQQANYWKRMRMAQWCTDAIVNYGTNDIYSAGRTLAQLKTDAQSCWTLLSRLGLKVTQATILPRPGASTDGYMTVAGQTITDSAKETIRTGFNSWLRDTTASGAVAQSGGALRGVFDGCALVEVNSSGVLTLNGGYWKSAGAPVKTGTATSYTASAITDTAAGRTTNQDIALTLAIMSATTGAGQSQNIASNTATTWNLGTAITLPTGTVTYQVGPSYCFDGTHPSELAHQYIGDNLPLTSLIRV
jgi:hypothetical protein